MSGNQEGNVLLVVSDLKLRYQLTEVLSEAYGLITASNGVEGLDCLKKTRISAFIAHVEEPMLGSFKMCMALKASMTTAHIPFLFVACDSSEERELACMEAGADDYIHWPLDPRLLRLKLRNMMYSRRLMMELPALYQHPSAARFTEKYLSASDELIMKARHSIDQNLSNSNYTAHDLGRDLGLSRMQLYRKLKRATGQSANEFIRSVRLRHAALMIRDQRHTIAEVTYGVGFTDLTYFRNCFKKMFGVNPSEYLQQTSQSLTFGHYQSRLA